MDRKSLSHRSCQCDYTRAKRIIGRTIIALIVGSHHPDQENQINNDTDNTIGHDASAKLEVFKHEDQNKKDNSVDYRIDYTKLVRRDQTLPLRHYELEVEQVDEDEVEPHADIVEDFGPSAAVEVSEDGVVEIRLVAHVQDAEIAGVEAEHASEENDDESANIT